MSPRERVREIRQRWIAARKSRNTQDLSSLRQELLQALPSSAAQILRERIREVYPKFRPDFVGFIVDSFFENLTFALPLFQEEKTVLSWILISLDTVLKHEQILVVLHNYAIFKENTADLKRLRDEIALILSGDLSRRAVAPLDTSQVNSDDVDDIRQQTVLRTYNRVTVGDYFPVASLYTLMRTVANNLLIDLLRQRKRQDVLEILDGMFQHDTLFQMMSEDFDTSRQRIAPVPDTFVPPTPPMLRDGRPINDLVRADEVFAVIGSLEKRLIEAPESVDRRIKITREDIHAFRLQYWEGKKLKEIAAVVFGAEGSREAAGISRAKRGAAKVRDWAYSQLGIAAVRQKYARSAAELERSE